MKKAAKWMYDPDYVSLLGIASIGLLLWAFPGYTSDVVGMIRFENSWEAGVRMMKNFSSSRWVEPLFCLIAILAVSALLRTMRRKKFRVSN